MSPQTSETKMLVKSFLFMELRPSHSALYMLNKVYIDFAKTWPEPKRSLVVSKMEFPNQRPNFSGNASGAVVQRVEELSGGTDCRVTAAQKLPGKTIKGNRPFEVKGMECITVIAKALSS